MAPQPPSVLQTDRAEDPVRADNEYAPVRHGGRRPRTFVEAELVLIRRRLLVPPDALSIARPQAIQARGVLDPVENEHAIADDDRAAPARADAI